MSVCTTQGTAAIQEQPDIGKTSRTAVKADEVTSGFRDPSFGHNRQYPVHRWVPWVAGFSANFVKDCLREYIPPDRGNNAWVLDPFAGVGTTLLEAYLHGYNVIGFEINPYGASFDLEIDCGLFCCEPFGHSANQWACKFLAPFARR